MTTIVMNTLTGAVSEYDWNFQSITPTHAGDAAGLYLLGGDKDDTASIDATIVTGKTLCGTSFKKRLIMVYLSIRGGGSGLMTVIGQAASWVYAFTVSNTGESRCKPGHGIQENYLALGYSNVAGADFTLDRIEADIVASKTRRI